MTDSEDRGVAVLQAILALLQDLNERLEEEARRETYSNDEILSKFVETTPRCWNCDRLAEVAGYEIGRYYGSRREACRSCGEKLSELTDFPWAEAARRYNLMKFPGKQRRR